MDWTKPNSFVTGATCGLFAIPLGQELFKPVQFGNHLEPLAWGWRGAAVTFFVASGQLAWYHQSGKHSKDAFACGALIAGALPATTLLISEMVDTRRPPLFREAGRMVLRHSFCVYPLVALQYWKE